MNHDESERHENNHNDDNREEGRLKRCNTESEIVLPVKLSNANFVIVWLRVLRCHPRFHGGLDFLARKVAGCEVVR